MLQNLRREKILEQLRLKHAVKVTTLAKELGISESTIRRDINDLDKMGKLKKVFGGAISINGNMAFGETHVDERFSKNVSEKEMIGRHAASLINDNDFVYIDAGTTTERMVDYIENKNATYVTNGITHALKLLEKGFDVYILGGLLRPYSEAVVGAGATQTLAKYNFTKCFIGASGVDLDRGLSTPNVNEAAVKAMAIERSHSTFVLADHSKFGMISSITFGNLEDACIITDSLKNPQYRKKTTIKEVK